jgi:hypothetical protein
MIIPMRCTLPLLFLCTLVGCQAQNSTPHDSSGRFVELFRWQDSLGLSHNDKRTVAGADEIGRLQSYFPEMQSARTSELHGPWVPLLKLQFHSADGTDIQVFTDYHLYRIADGVRGDFIVRDGFSDEVDHIFLAPPPPPS